MKISDIIKQLEVLAHPALQESYDNSGIIAGDPSLDCTGVLCALDITEEVISEAIELGTNLIVTHHPILFKPIKNLQPKSLVEKCIIQAIKNDLILYALHTNYDNVKKGVNLALAKKIDLNEASLQILQPTKGRLEKLFTFVPGNFAAILKNGLFAAGAGNIGLYEECSFSVEGTGSFKPMKGSNPFIGQEGGKREEISEVKIEVIYPTWLRKDILNALKMHHPYEEIAYEIIKTENEFNDVGSAMIGELSQSMKPSAFIEHLQDKLKIPVIRHTKLTSKLIKKVAVCGGAGAFLIPKAMHAGADAFLTADLKYHDFFEPENKMLLADIGHFESEIPAVRQLSEYLHEKFPNFAVLQTKINTNPVHYFTSK